MLRELKGRLKWKWHNGKPTAQRSMPYWGSRVFFPRHSEAIRRTCSEGVYERELVDRLLALIKPSTWVFDIGANLGLISIPLVKSELCETLISFEPSPNSLPYLLKTRDASGQSEKWVVVEKALGNEPGTTSMSICASHDGLYDSIVDTRRAPIASETSVEVTTLDQEWDVFGRPQVSVLKVDVEGFESHVLLGGEKLVAECRPAIAIEWCHLNMITSTIEEDWLYNWAIENSYHIIECSSLCTALSREHFLFMMRFSESFILLAHANGESLDC